MVVAQRVRANALARQRRNDGVGFLSTTFDQRIDAEAGDRLAARVKKAPLVRRPLCQQGCECLHGDEPEMAMADLIAFAH